MPGFKIGFTGTQKGMTDAQYKQVDMWVEGELVLHHGDCVGADEQAHELAALRHLSIVVHPPEDEKKRAFAGICKDHEDDGCRCFVEIEWRKPLPFIQRNHAIVDETNVLVAAPSGPEKSNPRSGTWATIRYARKQGKPVFIVMPNGSMGP